MKKILSLVLSMALLASLCIMGGAVAENDLAFQKFDHEVEVHIGMSVSPTDTSLEEGDTYDNNYYTRYLLDNAVLVMTVDVAKELEEALV